MRIGVAAYWLTHYRGEMFARYAFRTARALGPAGRRPFSAGGGGGGAGGAVFGVVAGAGITCAELGLRRPRQFDGVR